MIGSSTSAGASAKAYVGDGMGDSGGAGNSSNYGGRIVMVAVCSLDVSDVGGGGGKVVVMAASDVCGTA